MADRATDGWLWAHCPIPCGRAVAIPLEYFISRYGRDKPAEMIFATLRCTSPKCGGHPTTFSVPSYAGNPLDSRRLAPIPWDRVPTPIRVAMGISQDAPDTLPIEPDRV
jgi:hypothetical protein